MRVARSFTKPSLSGRWLAAVLFAALVAMSASCGQKVRVGAPFLVEDPPPDSERAPASFAVVPPPSPIRPFHSESPDLEKAVRSAIAEGLAEATRSLAREAVLAPKAPSEGVDFIVQPANVYIEFDQSSTADLSMDVTIKRLRDGKEFGMLVEAHAPAGKRPVAIFQGHKSTLHLTGAHLSNDRYGQALNNVLFQACYDYLDKLERRMPTLFEE